MDATDKRLLQLLQEDAKTPISRLAEALSLTKSPIYDRIRRFEREGLIDRYVAVLDPKISGAAIVVFCSVSLESQKLEAINAFADAIKEIPEVMECYLMGGASDFLIKVMVRDLNDYKEFSNSKLAALPNVAQIQSTFVLDTIKKSTVMPVY